jgi:hypothetical protein
MSDLFASTGVRVHPEPSRGASRTGTDDDAGTIEVPNETGE